MLKKHNHSILMLHGLGGSPGELAYLQTYFEHKKYHVSAPYLPRHGTDFRDLKKLTTTELIEFAQTAFNDLQAKSEKISVLGLCLGSVLGLKLAIDNPGLIGNLIAVSTTLFYDGWGLPGFTRFLPLLRYTPAYLFYNLPESEPYGVKNLEIRKWIKSAMSSDSKTHYSKIPLKSIFEMTDLIELIKKDIHKISCPTLAIHAKEDEVSSLKSVEFMEQTIAPQFFKKFILHDSYHLATVDQERQLVAKVAYCLLEMGDVPQDLTASSDLKKYFLKVQGAA